MLFVGDGVCDFGLKCMRLVLEEMRTDGKSSGLGRRGVWGGGDRENRNNPYVFEDLSTIAGLCVCSHTLFDV